MTASSSKNIGNSRIESNRRLKIPRNITNRGMQGKVGKFITTAMTPKQIRNVKTDGGNARNRKGTSTITENTPARVETAAQQHR